jgi:hypothetical protein
MTGEDVGGVALSTRQRFAHFEQHAQSRMVRMGNASVDRSNVAGQRLKAAGKAERNVIRKRFATGERFDFAPAERFDFADGIENPPARRVGFSR